MTALTLTAADARYPERLRERLSDAAPNQLTTLGNLGLLALPKTTLFCSTRCPGHANFIPTGTLILNSRPR
jgi:hypothetical protein